MNSKANWTFFSNHGHIYLLTVLEKNITKVQIAERVGLSERAVADILDDLIEEGYVKKIKIGRRNQYNAQKNKTLRHSLEKKVKLSEIVKLFE